MFSHEECNVGEVKEKVGESPKQDLVNSSLEVKRISAVWEQLTEFHHKEADKWRYFLVVNRQQVNKLAKLSLQRVL